MDSSNNLIKTMLLPKEIIMSLVKQPHQSNADTEGDYYDLLLLDRKGHLQFSLNRFSTKSYVVKRDLRLFVFNRTRQITN